MSRASLRAGIQQLRGQLVLEPCRLIVVPHDGEQPAHWWFASLPLAGVWQAVSIEGDADHAAERIRAMRPRCPTVLLLSCDRPVGQVLA